MNVHCGVPRILCHAAQELMKKPGIAVLHKPVLRGRRAAPGGGRPFVYNYDISGWEAADELYKAAGRCCFSAGC